MDIIEKVEKSIDRFNALALVKICITQQWLPHSLAQGMPCPNPLQRTKISHPVQNSVIDLATAGWVNLVKCIYKITPTWQSYLVAIMLLLTTGTTLTKLQNWHIELYISHRIERWHLPCWCASKKSAVCSPKPTQEGNITYGENGHNREGWKKKKSIYRFNTLVLVKKANGKLYTSLNPLPLN